VLKLNLLEFASLEPAAAGLSAESDAARKALVGALTGTVDTWGLGAMVLTLGREGVLLAAEGRVYWAHPPRVPVVNTAGAGDALGAGLMWGRCQGAGWPAALALGTAAAASVVANEGTAICERAQVVRLLAGVRIWRVEPRSGEARESSSVAGQTRLARLLR
jgi:fructose-1-phosphate kinase PfkB-like protein